MHKNFLKQIARLAGPVMLGLILIGGAILALPAAETLAQEPDPVQGQEVIKTAYVVVRYGDNDVDVRTITFTGTISGWTALERAGLNPVGYVHPSFGQALCGINGVGQVNGTDDGCDNGLYWWGTKDVVTGTWQDNMGVGTTFNDDGHVSGFVWGTAWPSADPPSGSRMKAAASALHWLGKQQDTAGGYGSVGDAAEILMAVAANGCDPDAWQTEGGQSLLAYLQANGASYTGKAGSTGKLMAALAAAGQDVTTFLSGSLVATMTGYYSPTTGAYDSGTAYDQGSGPHAWAVLGMRAAGQTVPVTATHYLSSSIQAGGCWEWSGGFGCDINATALAVQALLAAGVPTGTTEVISGVTWIQSRQNSDGGFPYGSSGDSDANSTAYAIQALLAAGEPLTGLVYGDPTNYLQDRQQSSGQVYWQEGDPGWGTVTTRQAVPPLLDTPLPISRTAGLTLCPLTDIMKHSYLPFIWKN